MSSQRCHRPGALAAGRLLLALSLVALAAGGCAGKKKEGQAKKDPYMHGSLRAVTRGAIQNKGYLFEIDAPQFVYAHGSTAIVRDGNLLEVLVIPDAENRAPSLAGKKLGVRKEFSPIVYLVAREIRDGTNVTPLDSVPEPVLPHVLDDKALDLMIPGYDLKDLKWNADTKYLFDRMNSQFQTVARVVQRPDNTPAMPAAGADSAAAAAPPAASATSTPGLAWFILPAEQSDSAFKIEKVSPELDWVLHLLESQNLPLVGAMTVTDVLPTKDRERTKVVGRVEIGWLRFGNRYLGA